MSANMESTHHNSSTMKPIYALNAEQYRLLDHLDIPIFKHYSTFAALNSQKLFLNPLCLVVLPYSPMELDAVSQKILSGMLSVLNIDNASICTIWPAQKNLDNFINAVRELAPDSVLLLGDIFDKEETLELHSAIDNMTCFRVNSFEPKTLAEKTELKAVAYQDLLNLKNFLGG